MGLMGAGRQRVRPRILGPLVLSVVAGLVLATGCAPSTYTYVKKTSENVYFKVPAVWHKVGQDQVDNVTAAMAGSTTSDAGVAWSVAFDAAKSPSADHILAGTTDDPVVLVEVVKLSDSGRAGLSFDSMRNLLLPVSDSARAQMSTDTPLSNFHSLADDVLKKDHGIRGVHTVFTYSLNGGPVQAFDQTVLTNSDTSKIYVLFARCSADCYASKAKQIRAVVGSFTVGG